MKTKIYFWLVFVLLYCLQLATGNYFIIKPIQEFLVEIGEMDHLYCFYVLFGYYIIIFFLVVIALTSFYLAKKIFLLFIKKQKNG